MSEADRGCLLAFETRFELPLPPSNHAPLFHLAQQEQSAPQTLIQRAGEPCERAHLVLTAVVWHRCCYEGRYHTVGFSLP